MKPFGSGYFGEWFEDEFGLPAYRYTCDQVHDPAATSPVNPSWRQPGDHSHQVGNDRLVGVKFTAQGAELSPCLPQKTYRFTSPLLGLEKSATGYTGWYAPVSAGQWKITLLDKELGGASLPRVRVNGAKVKVESLAGGVAFWGDSAPGHPLNWEVTIGR